MTLTFLLEDSVLLRLACSSAEFTSLEDAVNDSTSQQVDLHLTLLPFLYPHLPTLK